MVPPREGKQSAAGRASRSRSPLIVPLKSGNSPDARETAARNRAVARNGGDPRRPRVPSFRDAEGEAFRQAALDWKGRTDSPTARDWRARMATYVLPPLGDIPVDHIGTAAVDDVLRPLAMAGKHPTARAVGTHIAALLRWAALREHSPNDNPGSAVLADLPKRTTAVKHHAALHYSEVGPALRGSTRTRRSPSSPCG